MIRRAPKAVWGNIYARLFIVLALCYIFANAAGSPFNRFDYIIVLYIFCIPKIDDDTALQYATLFGIFYDLNHQIFIGLGILLFQLLNVIKIYAYLMIDMSKPYSRLLFAVGVLIVYLLLTLQFFGYPASTYWQSFAHYFIADIIALAIIIVFIGGKRAFSRS